MKLSQAWKELRIVQKQSLSLREDHLSRLAEFYAETRQTTKEVELKKLQHIEQVQRTSAKHKRFLKNRHGMLRSLLVQDFKQGVIQPVIGCVCLLFFLALFYSRTWKLKQFQGLYSMALLWAVSIDFEELVAFDGWKNLTSEEQINQRLIIRNTTHLAQSGDTPFVSGSLGKAIGIDGENSAVDEILQGNFDIEKFIIEDNLQFHPLLPESIRAFIKALKTPSSTTNKLPLTELPSIITPSEYCEIFNHTKEATASLPPIHYGHFKAACESDTLIQILHL